MFFFNFTDEYVELFPEKLKKSETAASVAVQGSNHQADKQNQ